MSRTRLRHPHIITLCFYLYRAVLSTAQDPGSFEVLGDGLVSAMMMFVGNEEKVYIIDKAQNNKVQIDNHPAWASEWDLKTNKARPLLMYTNPFCSSGMFLPNGSWATFGGNSAIEPGGHDPGPPAHDFQAPYNVWDGRTTIRIMDPCPSGQICNWYDNTTYSRMLAARWYSTAEPQADGSIAIIGGFTNGGYINRNYPVLPPGCDFDTQCNQSEPTYEFFPANDRGKTKMPFLVRTAGLNAYPHAFLMPDGRMFLQANLSSILWDPKTGQETPLPDMPGGVVRVYPASGAVAMLPLSLSNKYTPTIIFCGGINLPDEGWGNYDGPQADTWLWAASRDCQRIKPTDSNPKWEQDDEMLETRTMGQFIILPDGKLLLVNGALNGTAGYANNTVNFKNRIASTTLGVGLADGPVLTPALYDPDAPRGRRWSHLGYLASAVPRLYHSGALLLPDTSVFIAGSNPNYDVSVNVTYKTEYRVEKFYPHYFKPGRPPSRSISGVPKTLSYGGGYFNITVSKEGYTGIADEAAGNFSVIVIRSGFTTHAMNMGQRMIKLENTFTVYDNGTIILHIAQLPPNPNLLTPGPAFLHILLRGLPSDGKQVIVGNGNVGEQPIGEDSDLPTSVLSTAPKGEDSGQRSKKGEGITAAIVVCSIVGGVAILAFAWSRVQRWRAKAPRTSVAIPDVRTPETQLLTYDQRGDPYRAPYQDPYRDPYRSVDNTSRGSAPRADSWLYAGSDPGTYRTASASPRSQGYDRSSWSYSGRGPPAGARSPSLGQQMEHDDFNPYRDYPNPDAPSQFSRSQSPGQFSRQSSTRTAYVPL